ncbi:MAG: aldehyde ferredoxin oxidoreductase, partial [Actinobacteria bacterium]|nr:aldehyde ferredoxin oxidoreductase [Actinomycetota bacterium]
KIGERLFNLKRLYNNKCGISKIDDTLPERFLLQPKKNSIAKGNLPPLDKMLEDYYKFRKWDENGIPEVKKIKELGIRL